MAFGAIPLNPLRHFSSFMQQHSTTKGNEHMHSKN